MSEQPSNFTPEIPTKESSEQLLGFATKEFITKAMMLFVLTYGGTKIAERWYESKESEPTVTVRTSIGPDTQKSTPNIDSVAKSNSSSVAIQVRTDVSLGQEPESNTNSVYDADHQLQPLIPIENDQIPEPLTQTEDFNLDIVIENIPINIQFIHGQRSDKWDVRDTQGKSRLQGQEFLEYVSDPSYQRTVNYNPRQVGHELRLLTIHSSSNEEWQITCSWYGWDKKESMFVPTDHDESDHVSKTVPKTTEKALEIIRKGTPFKKRFTIANQALEAIRTRNFSNLRQFNLDKESLEEIQNNWENNSSLSSIEEITSVDDRGRFGNSKFILKTSEPINTWVLSVDRNNVVRFIQQKTPY